MSTLVIFVGENSKSRPDFLQQTNGIATPLLNNSNTRTPKKNQILMASLGRMMSMEADIQSFYEAILDLRASEHNCPVKTWFVDLKPATRIESITIASGKSMSVQGEGLIQIMIDDFGIIVQNMNYVPILHTTLLSAKFLTLREWKIDFSQTLQNWPIRDIKWSWRLNG